MMNHLVKRRKSLHLKLVIIYVFLLCLSLGLVGMASYQISRDALIRSGEKILKNGVNQASHYIYATYALVEAGVIEEEVALERVRTTLVGPKNSDGTRIIESLVDLGRHGYFFIYDLAGNEVLHPTLEGQNVWFVTDMANKNRFIVQEQIEMALNKGSGFMRYHWLYPGDTVVGEKLSYGAYIENRGWVVVASTYLSDFSQQTRLILLVLLVVTFSVALLMSLVMYHYVKKVVEPILDVAKSMDQVAEGHFVYVGDVKTEDEAQVLVEGFNGMVEAIEKADRALEDKNEKLQYLAYHDEMTGLLNYHGLMAKVDERLQADQTVAYMLQFNISGLKTINAVIGYEQGNELLRSVGKYLTGHIHHDLLARTASNEFTVWLDIQEASSLKVYVKTMIDQTKNKLRELGFGQGVDLNAVVSLYPDDGKSFSSLYEKLTLTMRYVKEHHLRGLHFYEPFMLEAVEQELLMSNHLKSAIELGHIIPHYQEKVDYTSQKVVGVEALARWHSDALGYVSPAVFIPEIVRLNLVKDFSDYMIRRVLVDYEHLVKKYGDHVTVSINITPSRFLDPNFVHTIRSYLDWFMIPKGRLILEVTEDVIITETDSVSETVKGLHDIGVKVSIDDFGTGYSSLNYLTRIDFDELKIDKSFIDQILYDEKVFKMLEIICDMAQVYGYELVAEGVETFEQVEKLRSTPLRIVQGYYYSKPSAI